MHSVARRSIQAHTPPRVRIAGGSAAGQTVGLISRRFGFALAQQGVQPTYRQAIDAAHAAAGIFEQAPLSASSAPSIRLAKLVNQYGPFFIRRLLRQQIKNRGRLTAAEKARSNLFWSRFPPG